MRKAHHQRRNYQAAQTTSHRHLPARAPECAAPNPLQLPAVSQMQSRKVWPNLKTSPRRCRVASTAAALSAPKVGAYSAASQFTRSITTALCDVPRAVILCWRAATSAPRWLACSANRVWPRCMCTKLGGRAICPPNAVPSYQTLIVQPIHAAATHACRERDLSF